MAGGSSSQSNSNSTQDAIIQYTNPAAALEAGSLGAGAAYTASQQVSTAINNAINSVNQGYDKAASLLQPTSVVGVQALDQLNQYLGLNPYNPGNAPVAPTAPTLQSEMQNINQADISAYMQGNTGPIPGATQTINGTPLTGNSSVSIPMNGFEYQGAGSPANNPAAVAGNNVLPYTSPIMLSSMAANNNSGGMSGKDFAAEVAIGNWSGGEAPTNSSIFQGLTPGTTADYATMQTWTPQQWQQWGNQQYQANSDPNVNTHQTTMGNEAQAVLAEQALPGDTKTFNTITNPAYQNDLNTYNQEENLYNKYTAEGPLTSQQIQDKISNEPGYQAQLQQGEQAINNNAGAQGLVGSGAMLKQLMSFGQSTLAQFYGNTLSQLAGVAAAGQQATNTQASDATSGGNALSSLLTSLGTNQANSTLAGANSLAQSLVAANQEFQSVQIGQSSSSSSSSTAPNLSGLGSLLGSFI